MGPSSGFSRTTGIDERSVSPRGIDMSKLRLPQPPVLGAELAPERGARGVYLLVLSWAFVFFSTVRVISYVPTLLALHASGDSSQHSLWTWLTWLGANLTMAAWLYEAAGQRMNSASLVSLGNALMCLATVALIVAYRT